MKKKLGLLTFIVLSMAITSCGCSSQRNNHKSSNNPEPISENHPISQDPIESQNPVPETSYNFPESYNDSSEHQHVFSKSWSNDDEYHWHDSICEHQLIADKEPHRFNDWQIVIDPTPTSPGLKHHVCSVCDFDKYEDMPATQGSSNPGPNSSSQGPASSSQGGPSSHPGPGGSSQSSSSSQQITQRFTVTWKNYDGSILEIDYNVEYGAMPSYDYETPVKPSDEQYDYVFKGWTPAITIVTSDQTYTATFNAVAKEHVHNFVKNEDTLEYVCSCGAKNGRDYELYIELPELHAGDLYVSRDYNYSFKNDDGALVFGVVIYVIGDEIINPNKGTEYYIPSSLTGQNISAGLYIGVHDETNIKYSDDGRNVNNLDVYVNNQLATKASYMGISSGSSWLPMNAPSVINRRFYSYLFDLGPLLPTESPDLVAWPTNDVNAAFTAIGLEPYDLPHLQDLSITSYSVYEYDNHEGFGILFYGLKNSYTQSYVDTFYKNALLPLGFTIESYGRYTSPDKTFDVVPGETDGNGEIGIGIQKRDLPTYTVHWQNYDLSDLEIDTDLNSFSEATYDGATPTRPDDSDGAYYFKEWYLYAISSDGLTIIYVATYEASIFKFTDKGDYYELSYLVKKNQSGTVEVPEAFMNKPVTKIASEAFDNASNITKLVIPASITEIGSAAFSRMIALEELTIPFVGKTKNATGEEGLFGWFFGTQIFPGSDQVAQMYDSTHVVYKQISMGLTRVNVLDGNLSYGAFYNCRYIQLVTLADTEIINENAFAFTTSLQTVTFSSDAKLERINKTAFSHSGIQTITVPNTLNYLGNEAFIGCESLTSFAAMDENKNLATGTIGWNIFDGCTSLQTLAIPVFGHIGTLLSPNGGEGYYEISLDDGLTLYYIPTSLDTVIDTGGILSVGAFEQATSITTIEITESIELIQPGALEGCETLVNLTIPYVGCTPDATEINSNTQFGAIFGTSKWSNTACYPAQSFTNISDGANSITYYLPKTLKNVTVTGNYPVFRAGFDHCEQIETITFTQGLDYVPKYYFRHCEAATVIDIGTNTTDIDNYAFQRCESLLEAPLYEGLLHLGVHAFSYCLSLTSVTVPSTVERMGGDGEGSGNQFAYCESLESATVLCNFTDSYMFSHCSALTTVSMSPDIIQYEQNLFEQSGLVTFTVPEGVETIRGYCFQKITTLTTINLPVSLKTIGNTCFSGCTSLTSINYAGTVEQWGAVKKNSGWVNNVPATFVTCSDGIAYI